MSIRVRGLHLVYGIDLKTRSSYSFYISLGLLSGTIPCSHKAPFSLLGAAGQSPMEFNQQPQPRFVHGESQPSSLGGEPKQGGG